MTSLIAALNLIEALKAISLSPIAWGLIVCAIGFSIALMSTNNRWRRLGFVTAGVGLVVLAIALPKLSALSTLEQWTQQIVFWFLSVVAVASSAAAVTARNPVYTAIWFAASLLGVAGLFLFQNAQFLGVATIVVYAGAIVVTFLFVLMLANPEGDARYDRISWAKFPIPVMMLAAAILVGVTTFAFLKQPPQPRPTANQSLVAGEHMAHLGGELFSKHMISVEVVGAILLVALVGAVAIVIQAKERRSAREQLTESTIHRSVIQ